MKKLIIGLILSLTVFNVQAKHSIDTIVMMSNTDSSYIPEAVDTSSTFRLVYNDMKEAVSALSSSLKVGTEHVYKVLIKQQIVNSITWLLIIILFLGVPQIYLKIIWNKIGEEDKHRAQGYIIIFILLYILPIIFGVFIFLCNISDIITGFVNPEYGAISDIIKMINHIKSN